ncbi:Retrovirus-related Pol polyprotein from transposon 17.6 [Labeo rohita]|uniref:ribonuclease H n=1 Tax=Labeo rohita TaxID=84645 RepID=A0ABQ8LYD0_LABRO|nr:Retrovirus-related Pol polyprotein from transposon 17.6 [Labeo rohita]
MIAPVRKADRSYLEPLPIIGTPFDRIGMDILGPLVKRSSEGWTAEEPAQCSVASYILQMRDKLENFRNMTQENLQMARKKQRYGTCKLLAKWQGPYLVQRKLGPVTCEILCPEWKRPKQILHVNLLREFKDRTVENENQVAMMVQAVDEEVDEEEMEPVRHSEDIPEKPGLTKVLTRNIILKDSTPIRQKPYRVPEKMVEKLKTEVKMMLEMGIVEPSQSEWSSPILLVPKKDGGVRFCTDFRKLNSVSCFDSYPMPRIDELIERLDPTLLSGLYQYTVMPFGLHGAPATFQRLMDGILAGCEQYAAAYLDDVVTYSQSWQEHLEHLSDILKRLQKAGLTINSSKCSWAQVEVKYLGYLLGHGQIKPQVEKLKAIQNIPQPQTKKQVRSFLGLTGWYHRFIPHFSSLASPLRDLTKKSPSKFHWARECQEAFEALKQLLCQEPILQSPDFSKRFLVQVDASDVGLGAVLAQGDLGSEQPVWFLSRKLFERERRYSTVEKEGLAIK